ncbi:MAG: exodeoxyribonuclease III [Candidatus Eutrophobiaceae bacterium]
MKVISFNANGIRSAARKGFFEWMLRQNADIVCIQETKAQVAQLDEKILNPSGYHGYFCDAEKKGYSGVAIYSRHKPDRTMPRIGWLQADSEGRYLRIDYNKLSFVSLYLPSGSSGEARQQVKFEFMDRFMPMLKKMRRSRRQWILCGDWNIAHHEIDLKNWRNNQKNSGFLPKERAWMEELFGKVGMVDAYRALHPMRQQYTWWSNRGRARENDVGWRIDYQVISPSLRRHLVSAEVYVKKAFSDHAPLVIEYEYP